MSAGSLDEKEAVEWYITRLCTGPPGRCFAPSHSRSRVTKEAILDTYADIMTPCRTLVFDMVSYGGCAALVAVAKLAREELHDGSAILP